MRGARRWMKDRPWAVEVEQHEDLRAAIKSLELEAERLQQAVLEQLTENLRVASLEPAEALRATVENLHGYLRQVGVRPAENVWSDLARVVHPVVDALPVSVVRDRIKDRWSGDRW